MIIQQQDEARQRLARLKQTDEHPRPEQANAGTELECAWRDAATGTIYAGVRGYSRAGEDLVRSRGSSEPWRKPAENPMFEGFTDEEKLCLAQPILVINESVAPPPSDFRVGIPWAWNKPSAYPRPTWRRVGVFTPTNEEIEEHEREERIYREAQSRLSVYLRFLWHGGSEKLRLEANYDVRGRYIEAGGLEALAWLTAAWQSRGIPIPTPEELQRLVVADIEGRTK